MNFSNFLVVEELIQYMLNNLRLSRVDDKFLQNILYKTLSTSPEVTTNQVNLFNRIVEKYSKQFARKSFSVEELKKLRWQATIIESSTLFTSAFITIENDRIYFKAPYNKEFVQNIRKTPIYTFEWVRDKKQYHAEFGIQTLKSILYFANQHYSVVNLCPITKELIDQLNEYSDVKIWNPTLVYKNDMLYVAGSNLHLMKAIEHVNIEYNLKTLAKLVQYGVKIDNSVVEKFTEFFDFDKIMFAVDFNPIMDISKVYTILNWLTELDVDVIVETGNSWRSFTPNKNELKKSIDNTGIKIYNITLDEKTPNNLLGFESPIVFKFNSFIDMYYQPNNIMKVIRFVNSEPISVK